MADILPSVQFEPDNPRPLGFVDDVDASHLARAGEAIAAIGEVLAAYLGKHEQPALRVRFSSVPYMPALPFVLYGFHILGIDEHGEFYDDHVLGGEELTYALVANHAIEVQRETALLFLYELVFRQAAFARGRSDDSSIVDQLPALVSNADNEARQEFGDRMRWGWQEAAAALGLRAASDGLSLATRYEIDPLPTRADVVRRVHRLRDTYNEVAIAREAVDKQVTMVGGHDPRLSAPGLPQDVEDKLRRQLASMGMRQWISQVMRDAEVTGNGYLVTAASPEPTLYALRPELVSIVGPGAFEVDEGSVRRLVTDHVLHVRGIEQFESPYGISFLEPVLAEHRTRRVFTDAAAFAEVVLQSRPRDSPEAKWAEHTRVLAEQSIADSDERLERLLWFPRNWLNDAREGLYFPGQERI